MMTANRSEAVVIVTRPLPIIEKSAEVYQAAGFKVQKKPCFDIQTNTSVQPQWLQLKADVWAILSVNALQHALQIKPGLQPDVDTQVVAVGPAVASAWRLHFEHPIKYHPLMNSEGVVELLQEYQPNSVKILTTANGREVIKKHCMNNGISYFQVNTYLRVPLLIESAPIEKLYREEHPVVLTATSSDILNCFVEQLGDELKTQVLSSPLLVGAQRIASLAENLGFTDIMTAKSPRDEDMLEHLVTQNF